MATKSRFIAARFEPEQQRKLLLLSMLTGEPGNMSAALRMLVERAPMPKVTESQHTEWYQQPEREQAHA